MGGDSDEASRGIEIDASGDLVVAGTTTSPPAGWIAGGYDETYNGESDGFVAKIALGDPSNTPPVALDDTFLDAVENTFYSVAAPGVLVNDTDADNDPLSAALLQGAAYGTVGLSEDGSFTYDPDDNFHGSDSFTYRAFDGSSYSDPATVTIEVASMEDGAPVANAGGSYEVYEGQTVILDASGTWDPDLPYETLNYAWDFDGNGIYDDATGVAPEFDASGYAAGEQVTVGLRVTDEIGQSSFDSATISILAAPSTFEYINADSVAIPDEGSVTSVIDVSDSYPVAEMTIAIDITHERPGDLTVTLTSPTGTTQALPMTGGTGDAFTGEEVQGIWTLEVTDGKKRKTGTLHGWSMTVSPQPVASVPLLEWESQFVTTASSTSSHKADLPPAPTTSPDVGRLLDPVGVDAFWNRAAGHTRPAIYADDRSSLRENGLPIEQVFDELADLLFEPWGQSELTGW